MGRQHGTVKQAVAAGLGIPIVSSGRHDWRSCRLADTYALLGSPIGKGNPLSPP